MFDDNTGLFTRVCDGQEVILEDWSSGNPYGGDLPYIEWYYEPFMAEYHNYVDNWSDRDYPFVCERVNY